MLILTLNRGTLSSRGYQHDLAHLHRYHHHLAPQCWSCVLEVSPITNTDTTHPPRFRRRPQLLPLRLLPQSPKQHRDQMMVGESRKRKEGEGNQRPTLQIRPTGHRQDSVPRTN